MLREAIKKVKSTRFYLLIGFLAFIVIAEIVFTVLIPLWREHFYDVLERKDSANFNMSLVYFMIMMLGLGFAQGLKVWVGQLISFEVRRTTTKVLFKPWVKGVRTAKNYTQSMTESLRYATELYLEVCVELIISCTIVVALIFLNADQPIILWPAAAYTVSMTVIAVFFNKPMIGSDMAWQKEEGAFKETLAYIHSGIDCFTFKQKLEMIAFSYYRYIRVVMYFALFTRVKGSLATLVPYMLLSTPFFLGEITLGEFMKAVGSFELIVINSTILLVLYPKLTRARASYKISQKFYVEVKEKEPVDGK